MKNKFLIYIFKTGIFREKKERLIEELKKISNFEKRRIELHFLTENNFISVL